MGVSASIIGRLPLLKFGSATRLPLFTTSSISLPLPRDLSTGKMMETSDENSTSPSSFLGASSTSVIGKLASLFGSMANRNVPLSSSYGPTSPQDLPSANSR